MLACRRAPPFYARPILLAPSPNRFVVLLAPGALAFGTSSQVDRGEFSKRGRDDTSRRTPVGSLPLPEDRSTTRCGSLPCEGRGGGFGPTVLSAVVPNAALLRALSWLARLPALPAPRRHSNATPKTWRPQPPCPPRLSLCPVTTIVLPIDGGLPFVRVLVLFSYIILRMKHRPFHNPSRTQ